MRHRATCCKRKGNLLVCRKAESRKKKNQYQIKVVEGSSLVAAIHPVWCVATGFVWAIMHDTRPCGMPEETGGALQATTTSHHGNINWWQRRRHATPNHSTSSYRVSQSVRPSVRLSELPANIARGSGVREAIWMDRGMDWQELVCSWRRGFVWKCCAAMVHSRNTLGFFLIRTYWFLVQPTYCDMD